VRVVWQPRAARHLEAIRDYLRQYNPGAVAATAAKIVKSMRAISAHPQIGKAGRHPHTRELAVAGTPYIVVYRVRDVAVIILAVLHGAQAIG
jgi:addiction module RelE/StbE family toxin